MKIKTIITLIAIVLLTSCTRSFTPYHAANNKMKCGRNTLK